MIPISKPSLGKKEIAAAAQVIRSGWVTQGPKVEKFEKAFARYVGAPHACAVSSCTTALHLALKAVGAQPGNVVITVSHSFISTANSVRYCGAEPVFVDIDPETFNLSPERLADFLQQHCLRKGGKAFYKSINRLKRGESPLCHTARSAGQWARVAAILVVHQVGMPCDLKNILPLARKYRIPVVEDAACAVGSEISLNGGKNWQRIGHPHSDVACFSFHPRKIITTGDGGMLTTRNARYDRLFRLWRHQGMSIPDTVRHKAKSVVTEKYMTTAFNYRMTDIQAAIGMEQLKKLNTIISKRRRIAALYRKGLFGIPWLILPAEPRYAKSNWQSFSVKILDTAPLTRDKLMQYLLDHGVMSRPGIMNAHQEAPYRGGNFNLKNSENARRSVMLLPLFNDMKVTDAEKIIRLIKNA